MADVRSLLRNEKLARRITHPHASYSSAGTLSCNVCNLRLQADSLWKPHLAGKVHRQNLERVQATNISKQKQLQTEQAINAPLSNADAATTIPSSNTGAKKRKADAEDKQDAQQITGKKRKAPDSESEDDGRQDNVPQKRVRSLVEPDLQDDSHSGTSLEDQKIETMPSENTSVPASAEMSKPTDPNVDEDEYAAFEAAIAAAGPTEGDDAAQTSSLSGAVITAAPVTAAELAAKEAEDANQQWKTKREEELEGEKEDATRALEEEFDEMDQLEARVKRLKEMREKIRASESENAEATEIEDDNEASESASKKDTEKEGHDDDNDSDEDDDDDDWMLR